MVLRWNEEPRNAVSHHLRYPSDSRRNHRDAARHCLRESEAESLGYRRKGEHIHCVNTFRDVFAFADETNGIATARILCELGESRGVGTASYQEKASVWHSASNQGQGTDEVGMPLLFA